MKLYTVAWLLLCFGSLNQALAQHTTELISTHGGTYSGINIQLDWAVGEPFVSTHRTANGLLTEGILQPRLILLPQVESSRIDFGISLSPNPTQAELFMEFEESSSAKITLSIFDVFGKLIDSQTLLSTDGRQSYDMSQLQSGTYFFHFYSKRSKIAQSRRVIKIQ
ncbi:MAG: T9SS type A sorting domain-containing protein [Saprospiraceae bacterium]|nr:T9SS type A sorting domain-containing protein [Saprospiraceae bacterium]